jgi:ABC-type multidrug transport system fused ATPase/permease subunit
MIERITRLAILFLIWCAMSGAGTAAQFVQVQDARGRVFFEGSETVRNTAIQLQQVLRQYPPSLREILRLDPSLLTNEPFLAAYPNLKDFVASHPEILRSPAFFFGDPNILINPGRENQDRSARTFEQMMQGVFIFAVFATIATFLGSLIKMVIDHRRWLRVSKVQNEVHSKLLDRFTSSQDLLAYVQTPAGQHFLESTPIVTAAGSRPMSAPVNRILWSVQAGVVLALGGIGLNYVSGSLIEDIAQPIIVIGVLALALGIGFVLSAFIAYAMSRRLGLLDSTSAGAIDNPGAERPHA